MRITWKIRFYFHLVQSNFLNKHYLLISKLIFVLLVLLFFIILCLFSSTDTVKASAACLVNIPKNDVIESTYYSYTLPGKLWDIDTQCRFFIGNGSSAGKCQVSFKSV